MQLPKITIQALDGRPMAIEDFLGKPIVVNLWAAWAPTCQRGQYAVAASPCCASADISPTRDEAPSHRLAASTSRGTDHMQNSRTKPHSSYHGVRAYQWKSQRLLCHLQSIVGFAGVQRSYLPRIGCWHRELIETKLIYGTAL